MGSYDVSRGGKRGRGSHQSRETPGRRSQSEDGLRLTAALAGQWRQESGADHVGRSAASSTGACGRSLPAPPPPPAPFLPPPSSPSFPARQERGGAARPQGGRGRPRCRVTPLIERPLGQSRRSGGGSRDGRGSAVAGRAQSGRGRRLRSMVVAAAAAGLPAAGLFYWVGALGALYAAAVASYRLLAGIRLWVLGSGAAAVGPALGAWAGECESRGVATALPRTGRGTGAELLAGRAGRCCCCRRRRRGAGLRERVGPWSAGPEWNALCRGGRARLL